ncbi:MAG TPA: hypothetical protein VFY10_12000, partial [Dehalococcoidia bacterium]|nr:hypothetical protein [Dehalococcoidia bacterium]
MFWLAMLAIAIVPLYFAADKFLSPPPQPSHDYYLIGWGSLLAGSIIAILSIAGLFHVWWENRPKSKTSLHKLDTKEIASATTFPIWEGVPTKPDSPEGWQFPTADSTVGNPSSDEVTVIPQSDEEKWAWFRITNDSDPVDMQAQLLWHPAGRKEHEYLAPWRDGNVEKLGMAKGRTAFVN